MSKPSTIPAIRAFVELTYVGMLGLAPVMNDTIAVRITANTMEVMILDMMFYPLAVGCKP